MCVLCVLSARMCSVFVGCVCCVCMLQASKLRSPRLAPEDRIMWMCDQPLKQAAPCVARAHAAQFPLHVRHAAPRRTHCQRRLVCVLQVRQPFSGHALCGGPDRGPRSTAWQRERWHARQLGSPAAAAARDALAGAAADQRLCAHFRLDEPRPRHSGARRTGGAWYSQIHDRDSSNPADVATRPQRIPQLTCALLAPSLCVRALSCVDSAACRRREPRRDKAWQVAAAQGGGHGERLRRDAAGAAGDRQYARTERQPRGDRARIPRRACTIAPAPSHTLPHSTALLDCPCFGTHCSLLACRVVPPCVHIVLPCARVVYVSSTCHRCATTGASSSAARRAHGRMRRRRGFSPAAGTMTAAAGG